MTRLSSFALFLAIHAATTLAGPIARAIQGQSEPDPSLAHSVVVAGKTYVNKVWQLLSQLSQLLADDLL
jgi:hypothetical protein